MKGRSHVVLFGGAAALAMVVLGCSLPSAGGGAAPSAAAIQGRSVLPGTTTPAASLLLPQGTASAVLTAAPTGVTARWAAADPGGSTDTLIAAWTAAVPGYSPVDQHEATITGSEGGGTFDQAVDGSTLTAYFGVDFTPNWTLTVRAHNAVGWGPWSAPVRLGGL